MKLRLFLDSSVIFAAAYSARGHARDLILRAVGGEITLATSQLVLTETRRNLSESAPDKLPFLEPRDLYDVYWLFERGEIYN